MKYHQSPVYSAHREHPVAMQHHEHVGYLCAGIRIVASSPWPSEYSQKTHP